MAQFFFHVRNGTATVFKDETGDQLADAARRRARLKAIHFGLPHNSKA